MTNQPSNGKPDVARVLIVDDMPQVREGLAAYLSSSGIRLEIVGEACDGFDAIRQAQALRPDIILMDLEMPVLDGFSAIRQIKASHPSIWIVALSIHAELESRQKAFLAGSDVFIEKGVSMKALLQAIQAWSSTR